MMRAVLRGLWDGLSVIGRLLGPRQLRSGRYPGRRYCQGRGACRSGYATRDGRGLTVGEAHPGSRFD